MTQARRRILLIDGNSKDRTTLRGYLQQAPDIEYAVWEEELGKHALATYRTVQPDCILLADHLPDCDGLAFLQRLREEHDPLACALVMLTGRGDEGTAAETLKRRAHACLVKDHVTPQGLRGTIQHALLTHANEVLRTQAQVLENMVEGVVVTTLEGTIVFTNRAFEAMFGYARGELIGQQVSLLSAVPQEASAQAIARVIAFLHTHNAWRGEILNRKKDGTLFTTYVRISVVELEAGKHLVSVQEDITERKRLEAQLREHERLTLVGTTAVNLTHEIGNRLNSLSTTLQLLERHLPKQDTPGGNPLVEIISDLKAETNRMRQVLQDIRALTNLHHLDLQPTNVAAVVTEVLQSQRHAYAKRGIRIEQAFPPELPLVMADWEKLSQVVLNLCNNAAEAMPAGGTLTLSGVATQEQVRLEVADTGGGITEMMDIFEPFTSTKPGGTGLGLAIVKQLVAAHNGTITYTSTHGQGTRFTLALSVAPLQAHQSDQPPAASYPWEQTRRQSARAHRHSRRAAR